MMGTDLTDLIMAIVAGTEQIVIVIVIVIAVLIFGAKKVPELDRTFGGAISEYEKAQYEASNAMQRNKPRNNQNTRTDKLEAVADTLGTKHSDKNSQELRAAIQREIDKDKKSLIVNNNNNVCLLSNIYYI